MKRYLKLFALIAATAAAAIGGTAAYFNDVETSSGNTFQAGEINLQIGNDSYYDGLRCTDTGNGYVWQGSPSANYDSYLTGLIDSTCQNSWTVSQLDDKLFFDFEDIKPGDWGEDTITIQLDGNDSWACVSFAIGESSASENLALQSQVQFIWWADDGDNVLETDEVDNVAITQRAANALNGRYALADKDRNIWSNAAAAPLLGETSKYLAKAWCFGDMTLDPQAQTNNDPQVNPGFRCSPGLTADNTAQHGKFTVDVSFEAVQARNMPDFVCVQP